MRVRLDQEFINLFPKAKIGILLFDSVGASDGCQKTIRSLRKDAEIEIMDLSQTVTSILDLDNITAWREAYRKFGSKPKKYKPTHEAFMRRLVSGKGWPDINPIVDAYLVNQAMTLLPHGGYDLLKIKGDIVLSVCNKSQSFNPLGGGEELTEIGEVIYRDDARILTRRWNYRDNDFTAITNDTSKFCLMVESPGEPINDMAVDEAIENLNDLFKTLFNGQSTTGILSVSSGDDELELTLE